MNRFAAMVVLLCLADPAAAQLLPDSGRQTATIKYDVAKPLQEWSVQTEKQITPQVRVLLSRSLAAESSCSATQRAGSTRASRLVI